MRTARGLLPAGAALGVLTYALHLAGWHTPENLVKLCAVALIGFWFLGYFETAAWVVLVALIIPWVDAYSVWRGPTKVIVTHHEHVFTALSYAFPVPGRQSGSSSQRTNVYSPKLPPAVKNGTTSPSIRISASPGTTGPGAGLLSSLPIYCSAAASRDTPMENPVAGTGSPRKRDTSPS